MPPEQLKSSWKHLNNRICFNCPYELEDANDMYAISGIIRNVREVRRFRPARAFFCLNDLLPVREYRIQSS